MHRILQFVNTFFIASILTLHSGDAAAAGDDDGERSLRHLRICPLAFGAAMLALKLNFRAGRSPDVAGVELLLACEGVAVVVVARAAAAAAAFASAARAAAS